MSEEQVNEGHPNEDELEETEDGKHEHGAEETDVSGAPQTGGENEELEPMDEPDEDAAGE